ncbi:MAG: ATP-dependent RecD-like DNA helicase [Candidatus Hodarchaeota archaeon]
MGKNFVDEQIVNKTINKLMLKDDLTLSKPLILENIKAMLFDEKSDIKKVDPKAYSEIIGSQANICKNLSRKSLAVVTGGAGTGKTTIIKTIVEIIKQKDGIGSDILILAPTGKASERLREVTRQNATTVHYFLAKKDWLKENYDYKKEGGKITPVSNIIIDETSMLDLNLFAALLRAIDWEANRRFILVGDPNQLPPIGTGKVFADIIDFLSVKKPDCVGTLTKNVRQLLNSIQGKGTGILDLADFYKRKKLEYTKDQDSKIRKEIMVGRLVKGGDIDKDLRILFWKDMDGLHKLLMNEIANDLVADNKIDTSKIDKKNYLSEIWRKIFNEERYWEYDLTNIQVLSPFRNRYSGVDNLNVWLQESLNYHNLQKAGKMKNLTRFDKVIQCCNRGLSRPLNATVLPDKKEEQIQIFNGELGLVTYLQFMPFSKGIEVLFERKPFHRAKYPKRQIQENLELAYAISIHKSQGSEFNRIYLIIPKIKSQLFSSELIYTGITRARNHCTLLVEEDISPLIILMRPENSRLNKINSSIFTFNFISDQVFQSNSWFFDGKVHKTLSGLMVRSKSEVIIANMLHNKDLDFYYERPLVAPDGTSYLPDFTIEANNGTWYWEHVGMMTKEDYRTHWNEKLEWYKKHGFYEKLITSEEEKGIDSKFILEIIEKKILKD